MEVRDNILSGNYRRARSVLSECETSLFFFKKSMYYFYSIVPHKLILFCWRIKWRIIRAIENMKK